MLIGNASSALERLLPTNPEVAPAPLVTWQVATVLAALTGALLLLLIGAWVWTRRWPVRAGRQTALGLYGRVLDDLAPRGEVLVGGELWQARAVDGPIACGEQVEVTGGEGLTLLVRKRQPPECPPGE